MIPEIPGLPLPQDQTNPVGWRYYDNVFGYGAPSFDIGQSISPVYADAGGFIDVEGNGDFPGHLWQYFETGMIIWSTNTCARILYGPILDFYGRIGQFEGPLGSPVTDVTQLPDFTYYAQFENGVLYQDSTGTVSSLSPLAPGTVQAVSGINPTTSGVTAFAQQKLQSLANNALQSNQQLRDNVSSIAATITSLSTGSQGCVWAGWDSPGDSQLRSHIFGVHFDFALSGCAGTFGGGNADLHIEMRLSMPALGNAGNSSTLPISAFLVNYTIDHVGSPFGAGDDDIRNGLTSALSGYSNTDLIGQLARRHSGPCRLRV